MFEGETVKQPVVVALVGALFLSICLGWTVVGGESLSRLDPVLRAAILGSSAEGTFEPAGLGSEILAEFKISLAPETGGEAVAVLVKTSEGVRGDRFLGYPVYASAGSILSMSVPLNELVSLASSDDVVYVEPAWRAEPSLDASAAAVGADVVHAAPWSVRGDGVVIGIVDTGVDYSHLDFRYDADGDGFEESSRILAILDQTDGLFGVTYSRAEIEADLAAGHGADAGTVRQSDDDGHGTHVAGIAAGDGSSSPGGYVGMAPEAWIVVVKTTFFTSDILAGAEFVFDQAAALGLPAVVNLSLGGHDGPHDGTSLFEQGLDDLVGPPGRAIVVSAGNEGDEAIHAGGTLQGNSDDFVVEAGGWEAELTLWYPGSSQFTITVVPPNDAPIIVPAGTSSGYQMTADGIAYVDNASTGLNPGNGDREVFIRFSGVTSGDRWRVQVTDVFGGGRYDAWVTAGGASIVGGDSFSTIDEPGNAAEVLTVGSFNTKATWPSMSGDQDETAGYPTGVLSRFSSQGPTRDGRTKPDLCAPGAWIAAPLSIDGYLFAYLTLPDGVHAMELGTSMAAPHVSGAAALLFTVDPTLTGAEIRQLLTEGATQDTYTGTVPNMRWGWGKLNVLTSIEGLGDPEPPVDPPPSVDSPEIGLEGNPVRHEAPFTYAAPEEATLAELRIYNIAGRSVFEDSLDPNGTQFTWNLRADSGEPLAAGLYLYVLVTDVGVSPVGRLVIER